MYVTCSDCVRCVREVCVQDCGLVSTRDTYVVDTLLCYNLDGIKWCAEGVFHVMDVPENIGEFISKRNGTIRCCLMGEFIAQHQNCTDHTPQQWAEPQSLYNSHVGIYYVVYSYSV